ncbi:MAG: arginine--tRNA ligase [Bacteroidales bacterium]|jgi:arginyl-tRNA synthetase|nr:arginine--tRNA ligase [Bacteroidales bacterium]
MNRIIYNGISGAVARLAGEAVTALYGVQAPEETLQVQKTRKDFEGDFTLMAFPLLKISRQSPEATATALGEYMQRNASIVARFNVVKGFLNITVTDETWLNFLSETVFDAGYGKRIPADGQFPMKMVEYSSPNTNKPLHLGHIRNNLLGHSLSKVLEAAGNRVVKVNLVNDRGIHICKSMLAWRKWGNGETPESAGKKGDHLAGDYYVRFNTEYTKETEQLIRQGMNREEAARKAPSLLEAQEMLRLWEARDPETVALWEKMNGWVYAGFDATYRQLGVSFDRIYYESQTYLQGKEIVAEGLQKGVFFRKEDGSIWINLTDDGLDEKLLLRSDGTSVYITQDLGTACKRFEEYNIDELVYVVGNEQNYHFQVLSLILEKLGYAWAGNLKHMSYGMVELPEGKMKSREGSVVDADDLMEEMEETARKMSIELGKLDGLPEKEASGIIHAIGMGALKYFILKVDPKKNMLFDPKESIDFNGNTGPFIQYAHARIRSILRKAAENGLLEGRSVSKGLRLNEKEVSLIHALHDYPEVVKNAADTFNPALIANYVYELAKEYNQFYHDYSILKENDAALRLFRIVLSENTAQVIRNSLDLLGIEAPDRM